MPPLRTPLLPAAALLLAAAACERDAGATPDALVTRDSAGIEIVENLDLGWAAGEGWRLTDTPELDIGVLEGDPMYQLFRVGGATRMSDGRVAIALAAANEIRIFGPYGTFLQAIGREGEGPGEFRQLHRVWAARGDSLVAWDYGLQRVTILDSTGAVGRQPALEGEVLNPRLLRPLDDGRMILVNQHFDFGPEQRDQIMEAMLYGPEGEIRDSVGRFVYARMGLIGGVESGMLGSAVFAPRTEMVTSGESLIIGDGSAPNFSTHDPAGHLRRVVRWPDEDRTVGPGDVDRYRTEELAAIDDEDYRRTRRAYLDEVPYEQQFPVYDRIVAAADGYVWLRSFRRPGREGRARWIVVDSAGHRLGEVAAPTGLHIFEIGSDYVLGMERDDLDVEHVRLYRLVKG